MAARFAFVVGDIADPEAVAPLVRDIDAIVNFAAESHVDRSILDSEAFLRTGVIGVHILLEAFRAEWDRAERGERRIRASSTSRPTRSTARSTRASPPRSTPFDPRSPYAAAKAAGDHLVRSYHATYGVDVVVTRGSNTYGPYQHPEKLIPLFVTNALDDLQLPMYGDGLQRRDWLHVRTTPARWSTCSGTASRARLQRRRRQRDDEPRPHQARAR